MPPTDGALIEHPVAIAAVLLAVLAALFTANRHPVLARVYNVVPLLVFAYFVPTLLSNTGVIPTASPLYDFIKAWLLPASLVLLTLSVDVKAILHLGRPVLVLFVTATAGIVFGGPLAYLTMGGLLGKLGLMPVEMGEQMWKGLAALSGSWIGGGANFVAIGESVGATDTTIAMMVIVDVAVANVWMAVLLFFAGRELKMDRKMGADRTALDAVRGRVEAYHAEVARPSTLPDLLTLLAIAFGGTAVATWIGNQLPDVGDIIKTFTWIVIGVTTLGLGLSFTPLRRLEGAGATAVGSTFLYLLVASIGAHADFGELVRNPQALSLVAVAAVWMAIHAGLLMAVRRWIRAPIFFAAVGSQANVGGAASAPIVAAAFHPALAPVGILLAVAGYVLGTYAALACAFLLQMVHGALF